MYKEKMDKKYLNPPPNKPSPPKFFTTLIPNNESTYRIN